MRRGLVSLAVAVLVGVGAPAASAAPPTCVNVERNAVQGVTIHLPGPEGPACSDPDGDALTLSIVDYPVNGSLTFPGPNAADYTAYFGPATEDTFTFRAHDGTSFSNTATVLIHIAPPPPGGNQPPTCPAANVFVEQGGFIDLTANCVDPERDPISYGVPTGPGGGSLQILSANSVRYTPGPSTTSDSFVYSATDNQHPTVLTTVHITLVPVDATVFSTPAADPVAVSLTSPLGGPVAIDRRAVTADPPAGFSLLGQEFDITAPPTNDPQNPLTFVFTVSGAPPGEVEVFRDIATNPDPLPECTAPGATPDPCVAARSGVPPDPVQVTVRSSHASRWNFGVREAYDFTGFDFLRDVPAFNTVPRGALIPVVFSLNGDQGPDVLAPGYPKSRTIDCGSSDLVEGGDATATIGGLGLLYTPRFDRYVYVWKTDRHWRGCRQLVVQLDDGTKHRANFRIR
jgi:hypothetical protein